MHVTVYLVTNAVNGKMYVRQTTKNLEDRFNHYYSKAELDPWEKFFIAVIHCKVPFGYNLTDGGTNGWTHTPEHCANISAAILGINSATISEKMTCRKNFTDRDKVTICGTTF